MGEQHIASSILQYELMHTEEDGRRESERGRAAATGGGHFPLFRPSPLAGTLPFMRTRAVIARRLPADSVECLFPPGDLEMCVTVKGLS